MRYPGKRVPTGYTITLEVENPMSHSFDELKLKVRKFVEERDWAQYHSPRNLAMALNVETSELLELYLWSTDTGPQPITDHRQTKVAGEVGDILMCLINFCHHAEIDILKALAEKLEVAEQKYPVNRVKGRALKYDEYDEWNGESS